MQAFQQVMLSNQPFYDKSSYDKSKVDPNHIPPTIEVSISVIQDRCRSITLLIDDIVPTYCAASIWIHLLSLLPKGLLF